MEIQRIKVIENMHKNGLVGIVRDNNEADAMTRTRAIRDGGCSILEISMSTPGALNIIETVAKEIKEKKLDSFVGAGTVLDVETARACILAGKLHHRPQLQARGCTPLQPLQRCIYARRSDPYRDRKRYGVRL